MRAWIVGVCLLVGVGCGSGGEDSSSSSGGSGGGSGSSQPATSDTAPVNSTPVTLSLVGYSVAKAVYDSVQPAFADTNAGRDVSWESSYGASGDQSRAVAAGLEALGDHGVGAG